MYYKDIYRMGDYIEYEYKFAGKYGAKGEKRKKKEKPTPEQVKKQNIRNKAVRIRRLIMANFKPGDLFVTLTYRAGTRKGIKAVKRDFEKFRRNLRNRYKKAGHPMKYIYTVEIGKRGGIHIHYLVNRIRGEPDTYDMICECWKHGHPNFKPIYDDGGYEALAEYMAKVPEEGDEWFTDTDKERYDYGTSRNLIRPVCERQLCQRRTVRKLLEDGPEASRGFEIIKESIKTGFNRFTGYSYLYYTERRIKSWIHREE